MSDEKRSKIEMLNADLRAGRFVIGVDYGSEHSAGDYQRTGQRFFEAMRREFPDPLAVSTTCARCSATIDPAAVEQHHERCFVVGDYVRWEWPAKGRWAEGTLLADREVQWCKDPPRYERRVTLDVSASCSDFHDRKGERVFGLNDGINIRHIQRPGQAVTGRRVDRCQGTIGLRGRQCEATTTEYTGPIGGWMCHEHADHELQDALEAMEEFTPILPPEVDPLDVKYGGVTLRLLLEQDEMRQRTERPLGQFEPLTPAQRAAVSAHWSQQLRARISAAKERERCRVRVDIDVEDLP